MIRLFCIFLALLSFGSAHAESMLFPKALVEVRPAPAARAFCEKFPQECVPSTDIPVPVEWTPERWEELQRVNREVNESMIDKTDMELYDTEENWTLNEKEGDCEDFVALKRHRLIKLGWPAGALLVTIVEPPNSAEMHAVLAARTSKGDFILDNKLKDGTTRIWRWDHLPTYTYVAQQSSEDPRRWVSLIPLPIAKERFQRWITSK
jgi:predicted transglutaminase-like cysteine proteinase